MLINYLSYLIGQLTIIVKANNTKLVLLNTNLMCDMLRKIEITHASVAIF